VDASISPRDEVAESYGFFPLDERLDPDSGLKIVVWGFERNGFEIIDPYLSECGRFRVDPSHYGLDAKAAAYLAKLNDLPEGGGSS